MSPEEHALENAVSDMEAGKEFNPSDVNFNYISATPDEIKSMASWVVYSYKPSVLYDANEETGNLVGAIMDALSFLRKLSDDRWEDYINDDYWWNNPDSCADHAIPVASMFTKDRYDRINYIYNSDEFRKLRDLIEEE